MNPALATAAVRDLREPCQQLRTHDLRRAGIPGHGRGRPRGAERAKARLANGRMNQQRSSGDEKSVRGLLLLPELHRPPRYDTPKITKPVPQHPLLNRPGINHLSILKRPWPTA